MLPSPVFPVLVQIPSYLAAGDYGVSYYRKEVKMSPENVSLIIGIVGAIIGVVSFFAGVIFYVNGNKLNRLSEKVLANIDAKVNLIQGQYSKVVDRSFDLAEGSKESKEALSDQVTSQLTTLENSLKDEIGESLKSLIDNHNNKHALNPVVIGNIENEIDQIIQNKLGNAKEKTVQLINISGYNLKYDYLVWRVLKAMQYGPSDISIVEKYLNSYCFGIFKKDLLQLIGRLETEGLVKKDLDFMDKINMGDTPETFWSLSKEGLAKMTNYSQSDEMNK